MSEFIKLFAIGVIFTIVTSLVTAAPPVGYDRTDLAMGRTVGGVYAVDPDGLVIYGHNESKTGKTPEMVREGRASSNELWTYDPLTEIHQVFYQASNHSLESNQINSACAVVIDDNVNPWVYYIGDQDTMGDYLTSGGIWKAVDLNDDGDIDDTGETELVTHEAAIINIVDIIRNHTTGEIFATNAEGVSTPLIYRLYDVSGNGFFEPAEITDYAMNSIGNYAGGLAFHTTIANVILTVDAGGLIYWVENLNPGSDDDCLDAGETITYATLPIAGGFDLEVDPEGDIFVTASEYGVAHMLYEIEQGSPPIINNFDDLSGFTGWSGTLAFDRGGSFEPDINGAKLYMNYTNTSWGDPSELKVYSGVGGPETPSMNTIGLIVLLTILSGLFILRRP